MTCSQYASQCLTGTAWQDNDAGPGPPIAKHFGQGLLLVVTNQGRGLDIDLEIWRIGILLKIVLLYQRVLLLLALLLDQLYIPQNLNFLPLILHWFLRYRNGCQ